MKVNIQIYLIHSRGSFKSFHIISNHNSLLSKEFFQLYFELSNIVDLNLVHVYRLFILLLCPHLHHLILKPSFNNSYLAVILNPRHLIISAAQHHFGNALSEPSTRLCLLYPNFDFYINLFLDLIGIYCYEISKTTLSQLSSYFFNFVLLSFFLL
jgi:hypothetical protein